MNDTSSHITQKIYEMIQQKTPTERLEMGISMYETSRSLIIWSILNDQPDISKSELKVELFLRFYGNDFSLEQREKIIAHLRLNSH
jgi:hypothetical protein